MNAPVPAIIVADRSLPATAEQMRAQVNLIQEVMKAVMKEGTHYGTIPGTKKPTLYKPGAEILAATFHIAFDFEPEDLSGSDFTRYRVKATGTHQGTGTVLGSGMGECSSMEEKYRWRKAVSTKEFEATPVDRRRVKYYADGGAANQVAAEHHDAANTVLKMACKRAQLAATLNIVAASDIFTQDLEDLPPHLQKEDDETRAAREKAEAEAVEASKKRLEDALDKLKKCTTTEAVKEMWQTTLQLFIDADDRPGADAFKTAVREKNEFLRKLPADAPGASDGAAKPAAAAQETGNAGEQKGPHPSSSPAADGDPPAGEAPGAQG